MDLYGSSMINLFVFGLMLFISDLKYGEPMKSTWINAQNTCKSENKKLATDLRDINKSKDYWTGNYERLSKWLHLLGCFAASNVTSQDVRGNISMSYPSVGICDEICSITFPFFGIKNSTCLCLQSFTSKKEVSPMHCNTTCNVSSDQPFSSECGGDDHFNVFSSVREEFNKSSRNSSCLSMQCGNSSKFYKGDDCHKSFYRTCRGKGNTNYTNWISAMNDCKASLNSSYLFKNLQLNNINTDCVNLLNVTGSHTSENWIGVARQIYISEDRGNAIPVTSDILILCQFCRRNSCKFDNCGNQHFYHCVAHNNSNTTLSLTTTVGISTLVQESSSSERYASSIKPHSTVFETISASISTETVTFGDMESAAPMDIGMSHHQDLEISAIVVPIIIILLGIIIGGTGFICWRKRKAKKVKEPVPSYLIAHQIENDHAHQENNVSNSSYFILEPKSSYEECGNDISQTENPYIETQEGEYDHLGNSNQRKKVTEIDNYDETIKMQNLNKGTEEGNYDHLGNAPSRSNIADDTYCHTSPNQLDNSSDYDVANPAEHKDTENTYDHAGAVIHLQNDSNYDYSELEH